MIETIQWALNKIHILLTSDRSQNSMEPADKSEICDEAIFTSLKMSLIYTLFNFVVVKKNAILQASIKI
jgi:hypothetical protein